MEENKDNVNLKFKCFRVKLYLLFNANFHILVLGRVRLQKKSAYISLEKRDRRNTIENMNF